jgi:hypothetical protein
MVVNPQPSSLDLNANIRPAILQSNADALRPPVVDGVVNRLLGDAVKVSPGGGIDGEEGRVALEGAGDLEGALRLRGQLAESGGELIGLHLDRVEPAGDVACPAGGAVECFSMAEAASA